VHTEDRGEDADGHFLAVVLCGFSMPHGFRIPPLVQHDRAAGLPAAALERLVTKVEVPDVTEAHRIEYVLA
jgi:hypothetical protein